MYVFIFYDDLGSLLFFASHSSFACLFVFREPEEYMYQNGMFYEIEKKYSKKS